MKRPRSLNPRSAFLLLNEHPCEHRALECCRTFPRAVGHVPSRQTRRKERGLPPRSSVKWDFRLLLPPRRSLSRVLDRSVFHSLLGPCRKKLRPDFDPSVPPDRGSLAGMQMIVSLLWRPSSHPDSACLPKSFRSRPNRDAAPADRSPAQRVRLLRPSPRNFPLSMPSPRLLAPIRHLRVSARCPPLRPSPRAWE